MMIFLYIMAVKRNYPLDARVEFKEFAKLFAQAIPALLTPIIIIGGIIFGFFTATEAAAVASLYTLIVCMFYYKDRKSTRLNSSHVAISYAVFCLKKNNMIIF